MLRGRPPKDLPPPPEDPELRAKWEELRASLTAKKKGIFLDMLRAGESVGSACRAASISRRTAYDWRDADALFGEAWQEALTEAIEEAEAEALRRGKAKSDLLLMFWLKAHKPDVYRDVQRTEHTGPDGGAIITDGTIRIIIESAPQTGPIHPEPE
jgi:hypothetical protein